MARAQLHHAARGPACRRTRPDHRCRGSELVLLLRHRLLLAFAVGAVICGLGYQLHVRVHSGPTVLPLSVRLHEKTWSTGHFTAMSLTPERLAVVRRVKLYWIGLGLDWD